MVKPKPNIDNEYALRESEGRIRAILDTAGRPRFRNTEFFRIQGNKIKEVEVYFGNLPEDMKQA